MLKATYRTTLVDLSTCDFCNEFSGRPENAFDKIYGHNPKSRVLFRSQKFIAIPSLGQIVEGYLLVVPVDHWTALGDVPEALGQELSALCWRIRALLEHQYGSCILFEHGTRSGNAGGCGVYHAHLHAVPLPVLLDPREVLVSQFPHSELKDFSQIREESTGLDSYLFYEDSRAKSYIFRTGALPSQYMRRLLADRLGTEDWDWHTAGREERLLATISRLSNQFDILPRSVQLLELTSERDR